MPSQWQIVEETDHQHSERNDLKVKATTGQKLDENMPLIENSNSHRYAFLIWRAEGTYLSFSRKYNYFSLS